MTRSARLATFGALLVGAALAAAGPGRAQSFDCATNTAPNEQAICADNTLTQLDVKMATMYDVLTHTSAMGARGALRDSQYAWLAQRALCGVDTACLRKAYDTRIAQLQALLNDLYARGPF